MAFDTPALPGEMRNGSAWAGILYISNGISTSLAREALTFFFHVKPQAIPGMAPANGIGGIGALAV